MTALARLQIVARCRDATPLLARQSILGAPDRGSFAAESHHLSREGKGTRASGIYHPCSCNDGLAALILDGIFCAETSPLILTASTCFQSSPDSRRRRAAQAVAAVWSQLPMTRPPSMLTAWPVM
jgi:hypothetical protein